MAKRTILIAEDDFDLVRFLTTECRSLGFDVFRSSNALHALSGARRVNPALIVLDLNMPGGNGLSVCEMLASDHEKSRVPIIIMSGQTDTDTIRRCKLAGARFVAKGPRLWPELAAVMCDCLSVKPPPARIDTIQISAEPPLAQPSDESACSQPPASDREVPGRRPRILSIDDDPEISKILKIRLEPLGIEVFRAFSGMQGFWSCLDVRPEVIISDLQMNDGDGDYVLHRLRTHSVTQNTPVIILTGQTNPAIKRQLLSQGAEAYLTKPLVMDELLGHLRSLLRLGADSVGG